MTVMWIFMFCFAEIGKQGEYKSSSWHGMLYSYKLYVSYNMLNIIMFYIKNNNFTGKSYFFLTLVYAS